MTSTFLFKAVALSPPVVLPESVTGGQCLRYVLNEKLPRVGGDNNKIIDLSDG